MPCRWASSRRTFHNRPAPTFRRAVAARNQARWVRVIARKNGHRVKLYSRPGNDLTPRFPLIAEALARLPFRSCIIDGEAVACGDDGIACFELIRRWDSDQSVFMWAFDLIELDGADMRREPLATRKAKLAECSIMRASSPVKRPNEGVEHWAGR
jgi:ATP-dependent DNA ligase